nr:hypothetical protein [uncultured Nocardioides sp.]
MSALTFLDQPEHQRRIGRLAWVMAWVGLVVGQLHALARVATRDGASDADEGLMHLWAEPASTALAPLLDWSSPHVVYLTYGKIWFPVVGAATLAAFVVHRRRSVAGFRGAERWAWRVTLTALSLATVGCFAEYWTQWGSGSEGLLEAVFIVLVPVLLLTMVASTFLGIVLIRRGLGLPAWLLALTFPGLFVISEVTSLGSVFLPISFAFGILGRRIARERDSATPVSSSRTAPVVR